MKIRKQPPLYIYNEVLSLFIPQFVLFYSLGRIAGLFAGCL